MLWMLGVLTFLFWGAALLFFERPHPSVHLLLLGAVALLSVAYLNRKQPLG